MAAVDAKYHQAALAIIRAPRSFNGQLVWLADHPLNQAYVPPPLKECGRLALLSCFREEREDLGQKLYVILYIRVSSRGQALRGVSLSATLRWMLRKCARHNLTVAAVAVDIESGREEDRAGLNQIMQAVQQGLVRCVVVPAISRLERSEAHFGIRMEKLAAVESWVYYGQTYEDPHFDYVSWADFDSRDRAVTQVRANEKYVQDGIDGMTSSDRLKLEESYLVTVNKHDTFSIYDIRIEDPEHPGAKRKIVVPATAKQTYHEIKAAIMAAAKNQDLEALEALVKAQSLRTGKSIDVDDLWWELAVGWPVGLNRRSPHAEDGLAAECPDLALEEDVDSYWTMLEAFNQLLALNRRQRARKALASDALDEAAKARLAEAQEARRDGIRFRLTCDCTDPPTPVKWIGKGPLRPGMPQDWVICPSCDPGGSGKPAKKLLPEVRDYRKAMKAAKEPCSRCGRCLPLVEQMVVRIGALEWKVYRCSSCRGGPQMSSPEVVDAVVELPRETEPIASLGPKARENRLEAPEEAPEGVPPLWKGEIMAGRDYHERLTPSAIAARLESFWLPRQAYSFTTTQLRTVAMGAPMPRGASQNLRTQWQRGLSFLTDVLARRGLHVLNKRRPGGTMHFFWIEARSSTTTDTAGEAPKVPVKAVDEPAEEPAEPAVEPLVVPGITASSFQRPRLPPPTEGPTGAPPLYAGPVPLGNDFYEGDMLAPTMVANRLEEFLMAYGWSTCVTTDQLRCVAVGGEVVPGVSSPILSRRWNRGYMDLRKRLKAKGITLHAVRRPGGKMYFFWLERSPTGAGPTSAVPADTSEDPEGEVSS